jgi:ubiquinone/menaquinone biosynthesis C-methylase UbiE
MSKKLVKIVQNYPDIKTIELGAGCGDFANTFYPSSFLTDLKQPNINCKAAKNSYFFIADATQISQYVPNHRFTQIICCNPYNYGFKNEDDAFSILTEFNLILEPKCGIVRIIGRRGVNPFFNIPKIDRFIKLYNDEHKTGFKINDQKDLTDQYPSFKFTDAVGNEVYPNYEIILSN